MISPRTIPRSDFLRTAWKNGLGYTDEISIYPPGSNLKTGDFLWRLSSARIDQGSAFSLFPKHDRLLVILSGGGIRLFHTLGETDLVEPMAHDFDEEQVELPLFSPYEFPGDIQSRCELISGPVQDLSVFIRKGEVEATINTIEIHPGKPYHWTPTGQWNFAFSPQSDLKVLPSIETGLSPVTVINDKDGYILPCGDALSAELREPTAGDVSLVATSNSTHVIVIAIQRSGSPL